MEHRGGKNLFTNNNLRLTLALTAITGVYINHKNIIFMSDSTTPHESSSPMMTPRLTKRKNKPPRLPLGFQLSQTPPTVLPLPSLLLRKPRDPKTIVHIFIRNASPNTPEAETYARILSAFPKSNQCISDGYLNNKGGIGRGWRAASFPIYLKAGRNTGSD